MHNLIRKTGILLLSAVISYPTMGGNAQVVALAKGPRQQHETRKPESKPLSSVLKDLEAKYKVSFNYSTNLIKGKHVNIPTIDTHRNLEEVLSSLLSPHQLTYEKVKGKHYIVYAKAKTSLLNNQPGPLTSIKLDLGFYTHSSFEIQELPAPALSLSANASVTVAISGRVTDEKGEAVPGVNVLYKGTTIGGATDMNGKYSLDAPDGNGTLVFTYIGFITQEVPINNRSVIDVALLSDIKSLSEVVVVGYGTVKKSDVTGSLSSVSAEQLQAVPVANISQALQGRAAGVDISANNFRPGEAPVIRIRGNRSLKATNNPLYVLDGIPLAEGSGVNDFNPSDIESIEVLKDASATAIYGSRGANGVILVTTKKGKKGKARVTYDGFVGVSQPLAPLEMYSGGQHVELKREAYRNNAKKDYLYPYADPNADYDLFKQDPNMWESIAQGYEWEDKDKRIPKMRPVTEAEREAYRQYYAQDQIRYKGNAALLGKLVDPDKISQVPIFNPDNVRTTDWADLVLRTGTKQNHQVGISGGSDNITVAFSLGYFNEQGTIKETGYERYNTRLSLDYKLNNFIRIGGSTNGSLAIQQYGTDLYGRAVGQVPVAVPYDAQGNLLQRPGNDPLLYNPLFNITSATDERRINRFFGSYFADITLAKGLRYRMNFGPDFRQYRRGQYYASLSSERTGGVSQGNYNQDQRFSYVLENLVFYDKQINTKHAIGVTLLQSIQEERFEDSGIQVNNLPYDSQKFFNLGSTNNSNPEAFSSNYTRRRMMSFMGRINYTLLDKYLLTVSGRGDGSSVLAEGQKWDFFPSFALAWKAHEEEFLKNLMFVSEFKLRVGYGKTGNAAVNPYTTPGYLTKTRYAFGDAPAWGFRPDLIPNKNLKWETTGQINAGLDFGFLDSRITGTVDVYQANTSNLIMDRQLPTVSGFGSIQENIGSTRNRGVEVTLNSVNVNSPGGFKWETSFIYSRNREAITELYGGTNNDIGNRWFIGQPSIVFYDYKPIGVWQSNEVEEAAKYGKIPGQGKFLDVNKDYKINGDDQVILGTNVPDWTGSISNTFSYKGLSLSFFFYGRFGQEIRSGWYRPTLTGRYPERDIQYWTPANATNDYPRPTQDQERPDNADAYLVTDGSFVKLRTATLSYTFPKAVSSRLKMENLNVYVTAYNPLLITKFKGMDPEFTATSQTANDQNISNNFSEKSIQFGVRVGF